MERFVCLILLFITLPSVLEASKVWRRADIDGMSIFSNAKEKRTVKLVDELQDADAAFRMLFPKLRGESPNPLRVVVCNDAKSMDLLVPLYEGKPKRMGGLFSRDQEGAFILINASNGFDFAAGRVFPGA
ncbi:MAG: hypothetical protein F6J92_36010 [Symploca sp. SIO1A3]|nr:hypothetical protein [Symploca sp. SIO1A3]